MNTDGSLGSLMLKTPSLSFSGDLNPIDITIVIVLLLAVFVVAIHATIKANHSTWLHYFTPCCLNDKRRQKGFFWQKNPTGDRNDNLYSSMQVSLNNNDHVSHHDGSMESLENPSKMHHHSNHVKNNSKNFFLAEGQMPFYLVGASLFASNIGSDHFIGQAGDGARRGLGVAMYEWYASILLLLLGWIFSPIYARSGIITTPEYLEKRFNRCCRDYLSIITCIMYVLTKMSASIYGGAIILQATLGWNLYWSAGACIGLSALYTVTGGLRAVMYTELIQMIIFTIGGLVVMGYSLDAVGGIHGLKMKLHEQGKEDYWHLFKPVDDYDYPWTGMLIGQPIGSIWYWCMDQDFVQRVLSAKDQTHSKAGCVMASLLKILPPFMMIFPGIVCAVLYNMENTPAKTDDAYPILLLNLMPTGVVGLMISSIIASMMSALQSVFNAGSTIVTYDIYRRFYPNASETTLVWVGRLAVVAFAVLSIAWIPILQNGSGLYRQVVEFQGYLTPPIGIVLVIGVCWSGANGYGAATGLIAGGVLGFVRLVASVAFKTQIEQFHGMAYYFFMMNFQHFAILLWVFSGTICILVSLATAHMQEKKEISTMLIHWDQIFAISEEDKIYSQWVHHSILLGAIVSLTATFLLWGILA